MKKNNKLNADILTETRIFNQCNNLQQEEVVLGLENNVDISIYAKLEFDWTQMKQCRGCII